MMHEITRLAVSGRLREQAGTVGGMLEAFLPGGAEMDVTLHLPENHPDGKTVRVHTHLFDDVNLFRWPPISRAPAPTSAASIASRPPRAKSRSPSTCRRRRPTAAAPKATSPASISSS